MGRIAGLLAGVALAAGGPTVAPAAAWAQAPVGAGEEAGDIIVTARRRDERLADVPASVTVITEDVLRRTGVESADAFLQLTPGVTIVTGTAEAGDTQINIRGMNGARDAESSVALVIDGILKTNVAQLNQRQGTLTQVEVLKGPQGAYYGRNAAAGAIVMTTRKPGERLEGSARLAYGEQDTLEAAAYLAGPVTDRLGVLVSGYYRTTDGWWRNRFLDAKVVDDQEFWAIDGRAVWRPSEATEVDVKARFAQLRGASIAFNAVFHLPNFAAANPAFYADVNRHRFDFYGNIRPTNDQETVEISGKLEHDLGGVRLVAWALYSDVRQDFVADGTSADFARFIQAVDPRVQPVVNACFATTARLTGYPLNPPAFIGRIPVPFIFAPANGSTFGPYSPTTCDGTQYQRRNQWDASTEWRLVSDGEGPLSWQAGFYYLHIDRTVAINLAGESGQGVIKAIYNPPSSVNPTSQLLADNFKTNVYAVFGGADYDVTAEFTAGLALRYDVERRKAFSLVPDVRDPFTGGPINPGQAFGPLTDKAATYRQLQPKVTVSWRPDPRLNAYANWGIGFKSGGFNNQGSATIVDQNFRQFIGAQVFVRDDYDKERSLAFEAGLKGALLGGRLRYDVAGYLTDVTDMQFFEFFVGPFGLLRVVSNIDKVRLSGAEVNLAGDVLPGVTLYGAVNVTDSRIRANSSRPDTVGNKSPYTADYTVNLGGQASLPLDDGLRLTGRVDWRYTGPTWFHTVQAQEKPTLFSGLLPGSALQLPGFVGNAEYSVSRREAFGVLNLRVGLETDRWSLAAFAENLLDRRYLAEVIPAVEFGGSFVSPGARRLVGVEAGLRF
ncbi:MAG: TonB-dependent receptor [Sphingomonadaceae bacterium]|uniref:TonB-dependent receptor n=1 Tax=Thermaurantiacus sp. TaxID=2820283 RepID=UPI00298F24BB|nr:TonB-dependent receptor [Thermaurantiacus sp.]MCS6987560.1 TonB-dependent receptor [Sphingomonadaceae bacterium]MDW8415161.1 TonB-dependent receptor [Thermaurantiacus sp.]